MEFFLDTASIEEVKKILPWGVISGLTTNQKIFLQEGGVDFKKRALELISLVNAPVSLELTSTTIIDSIREAREYYSWDTKHVVVKVAMRGNGSGLEIIHELHSEGIPVNATVMMTSAQAVLAAKAGASYVSLFFNRIRDAGEDPVLAIKQSRSILDESRLTAKIIAGSIRNPSDVIDAAIAGAHILTVPYKIMTQMPFHPKSEETIQEFDNAWKEFLKLSQKSAEPKTTTR
ncbi:MAG TPA: transaldolase family protein [Candidatus Bathyarchaeia archaeon]|nr:transaldolase family protein [Candidatus Bathyarchaeia archaeon]